jgi:hypothetical protein
MRFSATVEPAGNATGVEVPAAVVNALGSGRRPQPQPEPGRKEEPPRPPGPRTVEPRVIPGATRGQNHALTPATPAQKRTQEQT